MNNTLYDIIKRNFKNKKMRGGGGEGGTSSSSSISSYIWILFEVIVVCIIGFALYNVYKALDHVLKPFVHAAEGIGVYFDTLVTCIDCESAGNCPTKSCTTKQLADMKNCNPPEGSSIFCTCGTCINPDPDGCKQDPPTDCKKVVESASLIGVGILGVLGLITLLKFVVGNRRDAKNQEAAEKTTSSNKEDILSSEDHRTLERARRLVDEADDPPTREQQTDILEAVLELREGNKRKSNTADDNIAESEAKASAEAEEIQEDAGNTGDKDEADAAGEEEHNRSRGEGGVK